MDKLSWVISCWLWFSVVEWTTVDSIHPKCYLFLDHSEHRTGA
jgi:hypothetical protein